MTRVLAGVVIVTGVGKFTLDVATEIDRAFTPTLPKSTGMFAEAPCKFENKSGRAVRCGWVTVRRDPHDRSRGRYRLAVAIFTGTSTGRRRAPVVFIQGGPGGGSGLGPEGQYFWAKLDRMWPGINGRTLVVVDARGTGRSEPDYGCEDDFTAAKPGKAAGADARHCVARIVARGDDPTLLSTPVVAADFVAVRKALKLRRWVLLGVSYGTRVGLELIRRDGQAVESAVFAGPVPPKADFRDRRAVMLKRALLRLDRACKAQLTCRSRGYAPWRDFMAAIARRSGVRGKGDQRQAAFVQDVVDWLYTAAPRDEIARLLHLAATSAKPQTLRSDGQEDPGGGVKVLDFIYFAIVCAESRGFDSGVTAARARVFAPTIHRLFGQRDGYDICPYWPIRPLRAYDHSIVRSEVPVLLFSGLFDPVTPPEFAPLFVAGLPNAQVHYLDGGHGIFKRECAQRVTSSFIRSRGKTSGYCGTGKLVPLSDGLSRR